MKRTARRFGRRDSVIIERDRGQSSCDAGVSAVLEFEVGGWHVQPDRNSIVRCEQTVRLEPRVMDLLVFLAERSGEVLSGDEILRSVWPHQFVTDSALLTAISSLRKALGDNARRPTFIQTVSKRGYRMIARCTARRAGLAVLPIRNLSGREEDEFFADGLTELLITELGTVPALRVISRQTVMRFKDSSLPLADIAATIGAGMVVTGETMLLGTHCRFSVQLVDPNRKRPVWRCSYELRLEDLPSNQHRAASAIAREISRHVPSNLRGDTGFDDVAADALIAYLRGRFHWYKLSPPHFDQALACFESALAMDPGFAPALAGIADVWGAYGYWGLMDPQETRRHVLKAATGAEALDARCAEAQVMLGAYHFYYERNWDESAKRYRRALDLNPSLVHARLLLALHMATLRNPVAHDVIASAVRLDPLNPAVLYAQALCFTGEARWDAAVRSLDDILDLEPAHAPALELRADIAWLHDPDTAIELECRARQGDEDLCNALRNGSSPRDKAGTAADRLLARTGTAHIPALPVARLLVHAGRHDEAATYLRSSVESDQMLAIDLLQLGAAWHPLQDHPEFAAAKAYLHLPA